MTTPGARHRRRAEYPLRRPPPDGRSPISHLPHELWLEVLSHLPWEELVAIRPTSKRVAALVLSPSLHHTLAVPCASHSHFPEVLTKYILPNVRHLYITDPPSRAFSWLLFPSRSSPRLRETVSGILRAIPDDRLLTLSIRSYTSGERWDVIGPEIARVGGMLERLDLPKARLRSSAWTAWMRDVGVRGNGLRELDLGVSDISRLPCDLPFDNLESLSISACDRLPARDLERFLANLPPKLRTLNLSYLSQLSMDALYDLSVTADGERTPLNAVYLVGIDHLTRADVRSLQRHWFEKRAATEIERGTYPRALQTPPPASASYDSLPRTPESTSSDSSEEPMPTTPESITRPAMIQIPDDASRAWEFGAMDEAMYTPRKEVFSFGAPDLCPLPKDPGNNMNKIRIFHSALLESDDEEGYRRFIGEVVDGTLGSDWGELTDPEYQYT